MTNLHPRSDEEDLACLRADYQTLLKKFQTLEEENRAFRLKNNRLKIRILQQEIEELEK